MARKRIDRLGRLRAICLALPEVRERLSHGAPTWFVAGKRVFVTLWEDGHHGDDFPHLWCAAPPGVQEELVETEPDRLFRPPYVGGRGWLGVRLDGDVEWDEVPASARRLTGWSRPGASSLFSMARQPVTELRGISADSGAGS